MLSQDLIDRYLRREITLVGLAQLAGICRSAAAAALRRQGFAPHRSGWLRGIAAMDPERRRAAGRKGGRRAHQLGRAHEFTPAEAKRAGSKGGKAKAANRKRDK